MRRKSENIPSGHTKLDKESRPAVDLNKSGTHNGNGAQSGASLENEFFQLSEAAHFVLEDEGITLRNRKFNEYFPSDVLTNRPLPVKTFLAFFEENGKQSLSNTIHRLRNGDKAAASLICSTQQVDGGSESFKVTARRSESDAKKLLITAVRLNISQTADYSSDTEREILNGIYESTAEGIFIMQVIRSEDGEVEDYEYIFTNRKGRLMADTTLLLPGDRLLRKIPDIKNSKLDIGLKATLTTKEPSLFEFSYDFEHETRWYLVSALCLSKERLIASVIDITRRKWTEAELEKQHREMKTILDNSPNIIARYDKDLNHLFINNAVTAFNSKPPSYYAGRSFRELDFSESVLDQWETEARDALATGDSNSIIVPVSDNQEEYFVEISFYPESQENQEAGTLLVITRDITSHKKSQQAIERLNKSLEERVGRRTRQINEAREKLEEEVAKRSKAEMQVREILKQEKALNELKSRFISLVSHEFRTPLSTVFSSTELLELYEHRLTDMQKKKHLHKIKRSVESLIMMLGDVSNLNEAEPGHMKLKLETLDLIEITREVIEEAKHQAPDYPHIYFTASETDMPFNTDEKLFRQVIMNLLTNSIKYTSKEKNIYIYVEREGDVLQFIITDEGIGISETDKERLFEPFQRGSNTAGIKGTGLGMTIIKRALNLLNGELQMESEPGKGTRFAVRLPLIVNPEGD